MTKKIVLIQAEEVELAEDMLRCTVGSLTDGNEILYIENMLNITIPTLRLIEHGVIAAVDNEEWEALLANFDDSFFQCRESYRKVYKQSGKQYVPFGVSVRI